MRQKASTRTRRFTAAMAAILLAPALLVTGTSSSATAAEPTGVSFTLEGCRIEPGATLPDGEGKYICPDASYTTGNLGKLWNELDLVPFRVTAEASNPAPATQTYTVAVVLDAKDAGKPGYDVISEAVLNDGLSHEDCEVSVGPEALKVPGLGGINESRYRLLTITQPKKSTCVLDYYGRLALDSHLFPGSALHANLANERLETAGVGSKEVSIPVKEILPQELDKDMTASQGSNHVWNITKSATPATVDITNTCDISDPLTRDVQIKVEWERLAADPSGPVTVLTHVYATNPAHRVITVNVTDKIYAGTTQTTLLDTASSGPVDLPPGDPDGQLVLTHQFVWDNPSGTMLNDVATATHTDLITGIPVPGTTTATAQATIQNNGPVTNQTATITDVEDIDGSGLEYKVASVSGASGSFADDYELGTYTDGPVSWTSATQTGSGSVTFDKTVKAAKGTVSTGKLTDTATLVGSDGYSAEPAGAEIGVSVDTRASLTINKTIDDVLQGSETASFTFDVYKKGTTTSVATKVLTFAAGDVAESATVADLDPAEYVVKETSGTAGFTKDTDKEIDLRGAICSGTVRFDNDAVPASAEVKKITDPAGSEAGWEFKLMKGSALLESKTTTNADPVDFETELGEGTYSIVETAMTGWFFSSSSPECTFTVNLPADADKVFSCTFTNRKAGSIAVVKTTDGQVDPTMSWQFKVYDGPNYGSGPAFLSSPLSAAATTLGDVDGVLSFFRAGTTDPLWLDPLETYTICELGVPAGFTAAWMVGSTPVSTYNPDASNNENLGNLCVDFGAGTTLTFAPGAAISFTVDNKAPQGGQRTIGYWKNWNTCSGGNQQYVAEKNDFTLLDNVLPQLIGDLNVTTCGDGVKILSKQDLDGTKRASDAAYSLAAQLLAAEANVKAGAGTCSAATTAIGAAQTLLASIDFDGTGEYLPPKDKRALRTTALQLANTLDRYNNGLLCS